MELGFILSAVRRYFWLVAACTVIGLLPGLLSGGGSPQFESQGVLQIVPPADSADAYVGDPDRYVIGQLSVLRSTTFAGAVADRIPDGDPGVIGELVEFRHLPETDIVLVRARSGSAAFSQIVVDAYLEQYLSLLEQRVADAQEPIDEQIAATEEALDEIDAQIAQAMAPYLEATPAPGDAYPPIPGIDQVVPSLASSQSLLRSTLVGLEQDRARVRSNSRVEGVVVERATLASEPVSESNRLIIAAGGLAGAFAGLLLAVVTARLSPRVLDDRHVEEILGRPAFATLPHVRRLAGDLQATIEHPPASLVPFIDSLCVHLEASGRPGEPLSVLVAGTERGIGVTTIAAILANGFAAGGSQVLLVDADRQDPQLAALTNGAQQQRSAKRVLQNVTSTAVANLAIADLAGERATGTPRRRNVGEGLAEATRLADVAVFDGGALVDSSSTLELARRCDSVVLVLAPQVRVKQLSFIANELDGIQPIAIWSTAHGRLWRRLLGKLGIDRRTRSQQPSDRADSATASDGQDAPPGRSDADLDSGGRPPTGRRSLSRDSDTASGSRRV